MVHTWYVLIQNYSKKFACWLELNRVPHAHCKADFTTAPRALTPWWDNLFQYGKSLVKSSWCVTWWLVSNVGRWPWAATRNSHTLYVLAHTCSYRVRTKYEKCYTMNTVCTVLSLRVTTGPRAAGEAWPWLGTALAHWNGTWCVAGECNTIAGDWIVCVGRILN